MPAFPVPVLPSDPTHLALGAFGALLLLVGSRLYRIAVVAPGLFVGGIAGIEIGRVAGLGGALSIGAALILAVLGGGVCHLLERGAVRISGILAGAAIAYAVSGALTGDSQVTLFAAAIGAIVGFFAALPLFDRALIVVTAAVGAVAVCWATGLGQNPVALAGAAIAGVIVQAVMARAKPE